MLREKYTGREETTTTPPPKNTKCKNRKGKNRRFPPRRPLPTAAREDGARGQGYESRSSFFHPYFPVESGGFSGVALQIWQHRNNHPRCRKFQHVPALTCSHPTAPSWAFTRCIVQLDWCKNYLPSARPPRPPAHYALHLLGNLDTWLHARSGEKMLR